MLMRKIRMKISVVILALAMALVMITGCSGSASAGSKNKEQVTSQAQETTQAQTTQSQNKNSGRNDAGNDGKEDKESDISEDGEYSSKEEVAEYIHLYNHLPDNYITKKEAKELGWVSSWGNLWEVAPGKSIGGDSFGNREGLLPEKKGRKYYECDIDFDGEYRNGKRIIYSNDGLVYYTEDHYESFEQLY